eukprot:scaffold98700_cov25-Tisochrysis_lutea.AAC.4
MVSRKVGGVARVQVAVRLQVGIGLRASVAARRADERVLRAARRCAAKAPSPPPSGKHLLASGEELRSKDREEAHHQHNEDGDPPQDGSDPQHEREEALGVRRGPRESHGKEELWDESPVVWRPACGWVKSRTLWRRAPPKRAGTGAKVSGWWCRRAGDTGRSGALVRLAQRGACVPGRRLCGTSRARRCATSRRAHGAPLARPG